MTTAIQQKNGWYIETQRGIFGPYPKSKLSDMFSGGSLKPAYLVSPDGIRWIDAGRLFGKSQAGRKTDSGNHKNADRRLDADQRPASSRQSRSVSSSRRPHGSGSRQPASGSIQLGVSVAVLAFLIGVIAYMLSGPTQTNAASGGIQSSVSSNSFQTSSSIGTAAEPESEPEPMIETPAAPVEKPQPAPKLKSKSSEPVKPVVVELDAGLVQRFDALDTLNKETVVLSAANAGSKTTGELRHYSSAKNVQLLADVKEGRLIITRRVLTPDGTLPDGQDRIHIFVPVSGGQVNRWYSKTAGKYIEITNIGKSGIVADETEGAVWGDCAAKVESIDARTDTFSVSVKHFRTKDSPVKLGETFKAYIFARSDNTSFASEIDWSDVSADICGYLKMPDYFNTASNVIEIELGKE